MLLCTEKMDVESLANLGSVPAAVRIVDDDRSMLKALGRLLASVGLPARLFREPLGFLKYATRNPVTVALIDIWTPGMSGLELQKELRAVSPETRVIIVTADDEDSVRSVAMQNGATAFFAKPFDDLRRCHTSGHGTAALNFGSIGARHALEKHRHRDCELGVPE
jgi:DNA-binding NtrC family response regulator